MSGFATEIVCARLTGDESAPVEALMDALRDGVERDLDHGLLMSSEMWALWNERFNAGVVWSAEDSARSVVIRVRVAYDAPLWPWFVWYWTALVVCGRFHAFNAEVVGPLGYRMCAPPHNIVELLDDAPCLVVFDGAPARLLRSSDGVETMRGEVDRAQMSAAQQRQLDVWRSDPTAANACRLTDWVACYVPGHQDPLRAALRGVPDWVVLMLHADVEAYEGLSASTRGAVRRAHARDPDLLASYLAFLGPSSADTRQRFGMCFVEQIQAELVLWSDMGAFLQLALSAPQSAVGCLLDGLRSAEPGEANPYAPYAARLLRGEDSPERDAVLAWEGLPAGYRKPWVGERLEVFIDTMPEPTGSVLEVALYALGHGQQSHRRASGDVRLASAQDVLDELVSGVLADRKSVGVLRALVSEDGGAALRTAVAEVLEESVG